MSRKMVDVENVLRPGKTQRRDADKFGAVESAMRSVIPDTAPGLTVADLKAKTLPLLPKALFPGGEKVGWWIKSVQLRAATPPELIAPHPNLVAYVERGTSRPAFKAALAAQLADFDLETA